MSDKSMRIMRIAIGHQLSGLGSGQLIEKIQKSCTQYIRRNQYKREDLLDIKKFTS